jgi:predicted chitinase
MFDLQKIVLEIVVKNPNYAVYKYQKIKLFISNQVPTPSADFANNRLSGDWLIIDIEYLYENRRYVQKLKLIKRELELSNTELNDEPDVEVTPPVGANTTNPTTATASISSIEPPVNPTDSVAPIGESPDNFILTKQIWRSIYNGKINPKVIEKMYDPMIVLLKSYKMDTPVRIVTFLSQINIESKFLADVEEVTSGTQYNNRADLGNGAEDGPKYIGRGLIKILGKNKYSSVGQLLNKDFVNNPNLMAADNKTHISASDTYEQLNNCIEVSLIYWQKISTWGNLNDYTDKMDINNAIDTISGGETPPNSNAENNDQAYPEGTTKDDNFGKTYYSSNKNLEIFTLICFGVNGGYDGYRDKINNWNQIRKYFI